MIAMAALVSLPAIADHHEANEPSVRTAAVQVAATITDIDYETREFTLQMPHGDFVTMTAGAEIKRLQEFEVGDEILATYIVSLAGDVRAPTEDELANPWQEIDATMLADVDIPPGVANMRVIKAVCTIEGMNRVAGTVMIEDPRGKYHLIGDVPREKFEGRMLGETIIMVYSQAVALTLEKSGAAMAE